MTATTESAGVRSPGRYIPSLDGLRGLGLCAVLLYHGGYSWLPGGFFSVSMFFTLSGFLITTLMLEEFRKHDKPDVRAFWLRRARRLLPAALLTLIGVLVLRRGFNAISPERLRGDVLAALGYSENWWLIHTNQDYGAIFAAGSPVQHFWSLAIEEQYYLLFPLVLWGLHRLLKRWAYVAGVLAVATVGFLILAASLSSNLTRTYYGTDTRAPEILFGILLAYGVALLDRERSPSTRVVIDVIGAAALVGMGVLWWKVDLHSAFLFRGGTLTNGLLTSAVILAGLQSGVVARFLSFGPFRRFGSISYGVYLIHWPIFLILNPVRLGMELLPTFAIRVAVTVTAASAMYVLIENPVRRRKRLKGRSFFVVIALGTALVIGLALAMPNSGTQTLDLASAGPVNSQLDALAKTPPAAGDQRVLIVGDSMAWSVSVGLAEWGTQHHVQVGRYTALGCGVGGPGTLNYLGLVRPTFPDCSNWTANLPQAVDSFRPNVAVVVVGLADIAPRQFPGGRFRSIGDPIYDARLTAHVKSMARTLTAKGAVLRWATFPHINIPYNPGGTGSPPFVENNPKRIDQLNALVANALRNIPNASMIDFAGYARSRTGGELDPTFRPDGAHLSVSGTKEVANWLGPRLVR